MKNLQLIPILQLLGWSITSLAYQQPVTPPVAKSDPQGSLEQHFLPSGVAADVRSVVLKYIANVTASLAEEYLKDLAALDTGLFSDNGSVSDANPRAPSIAEATVNSDEKVSPDHGEAAVSQDSQSPLLPPSWPQVSIDSLAAGCSPPCNCDDNPTTACCIKVCARRLSATDQQSSNSTTADSEPKEAQTTVSTAASEPDADIRLTCPCDCNNPKTTCCIKTCARILNVELDDQSAKSAPVLSSNINQAQKPLAGDSIKTADIRTKDAEVGMVGLRTSTGSLLEIGAESDLQLYASFVSNNLVQSLGLASEVRALTADKKSTVVINGQDCQVIGTMPIEVEGYTQKNFAFKDLFYVFQSTTWTGPEIVFGIDHVRQAQGLALKPEVFA